MARRYPYDEHLVDCPKCSSYGAWDVEYVVIYDMRMVGGEYETITSLGQNKDTLILTCDLCGYKQLTDTKDS